MITVRPFGRTPDGRGVEEYTLTNQSGMTAKIITYGGAVRELHVPDRNGKMADVVQGFEDLESYVADSNYLGVLVGRCANRIRKGQFTLEGKSYQLSCNHLGNSLHGGKVGFNKRLWRAEPKDGEEPELHLFYVSVDGEEGYPGTLSVEVTYKLLADNALSIHYLAKTDKTTLCSLTNHSFFNIGGYDSGKIDSQLLWLDSDRYLPVGEGFLPTGEIASVEGTPFDFRTAKPIGRDLDPSNPCFAVTGGYDHFLFFTEKQGERLPLRATLYDPVSGRKMELFTDRPGVQIYGSNMLDNPDYPLKGGLPQTHGIALAMEAAGPIDAINHPNFGSVVLSPKDVYDSTAIYRFSIE